MNLLKCSSCCFVYIGMLLLPTSAAAQGAGEASELGDSYPVATVQLMKSCQGTPSANACIFDVRATASGTLKVCTRAERSGERWRATIAQVFTAGAASAVGSGSKTNWTGCISRKVVNGGNYEALITYEGPPAGSYAGVDVQFTAPAAHVQARPTFLSFMEGSPGLPGDGRVINADRAGLDNISSKFDVSPIYPFGQLTDGFTVTVFLPKGVNNFESQSFAITNHAYFTGAPCAIKFGAGGGIPAGTVSLNGVTGYYTNYPQAWLNSVLDFANLTHPDPGCNFTLNNLYIGGLYLYQSGTTPVAYITELDAVAVGAGEYNFPGTPIP